MARIISFAHTTPALVNGRKTQTLRNWKPEYARRFHHPDVLTAYDKNPRNGGKPVAVLRVSGAVWQVNPAEFTRKDFDREGFGYLAATGELEKVIRQVCAGKKVARSDAEGVQWLWEQFKALPPMYLLRFSLLELLPGASDYLRPGVVPVELPLEVL